MQVKVENLAFGPGGSILIASVGARDSLSDMELA